MLADAVLMQELAGGVDIDEGSVSEQDSRHEAERDLADDSMIDSQSDRWRRIYRFKRWANLHDRAHCGPPDGRAAIVKAFEARGSKTAALTLDQAEMQA